MPATVTVAGSASATIDSSRAADRLGRLPRAHAVGPGGPRSNERVLRLRHLVADLLLLRLAEGFRLGADGSGPTGANHQRTAASRLAAIELTRGARTVDQAEHEEHDGDEDEHQTNDNHGSPPPLSG